MLNMFKKKNWENRTWNCVGWAYDAPILLSLTLLHFTFDRNLLAYTGLLIITQNNFFCLQSEYIHYLPACAAILRSLVHYDYKLRHRLARDKELYLVLLRGNISYTVPVHCSYVFFEIWYSGFWKSSID